MPQPLHPAVVHFPIALLLLAAPVAVAAAFARTRYLSIITALLLGLGASGALVAGRTGETDAETVAETAGAEAVLERHEEWAERTQGLAIGAAVLAIGAVALARWPRFARGAGLLAAAGALAAAWCVAETGHLGGTLVYRHGAGVGAANGVAATSPRRDADAD